MDENRNTNSVVCCQYLCIETEDEAISEISSNAIPGLSDFAAARNRSDNSAIAADIIIGFGYATGGRRGRGRKRDIRNKGEM